MGRTAIGEGGRGAAVEAGAGNAGGVMSGLSASEMIAAVWRVSSSGRFGVGYTRMSDAEWKTALRRASVVATRGLDIACLIWVSAPVRLAVRAVLSAAWGGELATDRRQVCLDSRYLFEVFF